MQVTQDLIAAEYKQYLKDKVFPCVAAKAAVDRDLVRVIVVPHMCISRTDEAILDFLYSFIDELGERESFQSAAVIFEQPQALTEDEFEMLMWKRLQALSDRDAQLFPYDERVSADVSSPDFSFSLKSEAFFIIGLHAASSRPARRFKYPALVFNPHAAFTRLRLHNQYEKMKKIVRKNDLALAGSINPMLDDFGKTSETFQYSGKNHSSSWQCPLHIQHGKTSNSTT